MRLWTEERRRIKTVALAVLWCPQDSPTNILHPQTFQDTSNKFSPRRKKEKHLNNYFVKPPEIMAPCTSLHVAVFLPTPTTSLVGAQLLDTACVDILAVHSKSYLALLGFVS